MEISFEQPTEDEAAPEVYAPGAFDGNIGKRVPILLGEERIPAGECTIVGVKTTGDGIEASIRLPEGAAARVLAHVGRQFSLGIRQARGERPHAGVDAYRDDIELPPFKPSSDG